MTTILFQGSLYTQTKQGQAITSPQCQCFIGEITNTIFSAQRFLHLWNKRDKVSMNLMKHISVWNISWKYCSDSCINVITVKLRKGYNILLIDETLQKRISETKH